MRSFGRAAGRLSFLVAMIGLMCSRTPVAAQQMAEKQTMPPAGSPATRWWHDITVLAHDSMRGRDTGSEEYLKAAHYVADQFRAAGLEPGGTDGYFQMAQLAVVSLQPGQSGIILTTGGRADTLRIGPDANIQVNPSMALRVQGPLVFVGYGLHLPGVRDDIANTDVRGKVVVYLNRMPEGLNATMLAHGRSARFDELRRAGAVAAIAIADAPAGGRRGGGAGGAGAAGGGRGGPRPVTALANDPGAGGMLINLPAASAGKLFAGSGHTYAEMIALADANKPVPVVMLKPELRAWAALDRQPLQAPNVVGILRGSDVRLKNEYLIVTAHLDHVGIGRPENGDTIYNGAMDNASGAATLMQTARAFHDGNVKPKRSIVFMAVTGEERGLLGSAYFATHPTVPAVQIVADLNTDMFLPIIPFHGVFGYGADQSDLGNDLAQVLQRRGLTLVPDPEPEQVRFIRSDQYSFIKRGIPALALKVGYTPDSKDMETAVAWRESRYHHASDDLTQPINFETAAGFNAMYFDLVRTVADRPTRPAWLPSSIFGHIERPHT